MQINNPANSAEEQSTNNSATRTAFAIKRCSVHTVYIITKNRPFPLTRHITQPVATAQAVICCDCVCKVSPLTNLQYSPQLV